MNYPRTKTKPWSHQETALNNALQHQGYMIAHDMGAGKSKTAVDFCTAIAARRVLILCPKSVIQVWPFQFSSHCATPYTVLPLDSGSVTKRAGLTKKAMALADTKGDNLAVVINYESAWREPMKKLLLGKKWDLVIYDESQRIKSPSGKASWFCKTMRDRAKHVLCLSGTPMPHSPLDIYAQYRAMDPGVFGTSFVRFKRRYAVMGGFENRQVVAFRDMEDLNRRFYARAHRVTKDDVLDLPDVLHDHRFCDLSPKTLAVYRELEEEMVALIDTHEITASNALVKLLRLQQLTGGYLKSDEGEIVAMDQAKADLLSDILADLPTAEPVVVFARFHHDLDAVRSVCEAHGRKVCELSGRVNGLKDFQDGRADVIAVQIRSGGLGVDLTRACYCFYYSQGFSLGDYLQSVARVHRPGQTRKVTYYHLLARGTVDEKVYKALSDKQEVVDFVLEHMGR